ncbi:hypothetical protein, partial [Cellulomonas bogoriensis]|uniref:hypothetical protein n=1 Tax=Cellulomonas bogoriensis TaxID=301388 RepID=UPI001E366F03
PEAARLAAACVTLRPGVALDPRTGLAESHTFRVVERARAGLVLRSTAVVQHPELPWPAELVLLAAARLTEHAGGNRRRGGGRCTVTVPDSPRGMAEVLRLLATAEVPEPPRAPAHGAAARLGDRPQEPLQHVATLHLTCLTPVTAARSRSGNLVTCREEVPGTMLLPILARALGGEATPAITGGRVVVTDATPAAGPWRSLPVPRSIQAPKRSDPGRATTAVNVLVEVAAERLRPLAGHLAPGADGTAVRVGAPLVQQAHAVIDPDLGRPSEDSGGLFVQEAIAEGTELRAEVWAAADVDLDLAILPGRYRVGSSSKDDYGWVEVDVADPAPHPWLGGDPESRVLTVWLTSDLLLRDGSGRPATGLGTVLGALSHSLGTAVDLDEGGHAPAAFTTTRRVDSWSARWGLPRPSLVGLRAGSVLRVRCADVPEASRVSRLQTDGLGERRAEGFGRVLIGSPLLAQTRVAVRPDAGTGGPRSVPRPADLDPDGAQVLELLRTDALRALITEQVAAVTTDAQRRRALLPAGPTRAQLGVLRELARAVLAGDDGAVREWCRKTRDKTRATAHDVTRVEALLLDGSVWAHLDMADPGATPALVREARALLVENLAREESKHMTRATSGQRGGAR